MQAWIKLSIKTSVGRHKVSTGRLGTNVEVQLGAGHVPPEWVWRERNLSVAWIQVVAKTPLSRAISHSFNQLLSLLYRCNSLDILLRGMCRGMCKLVETGRVGEFLSSGSGTKFRQKLVVQKSRSWTCRWTGVDDQWLNIRGGQVAEDTSTEREIRIE